MIERAALLAEGADFAEVMAWVIAHGGKPESAVAAAPRRGLHSSRADDSAGAATPMPLRFVLPAGALG
ncbi:MAG: hypothetical protein QOG35_1497 [Solirubrobacteraceae bacterium]|nr:hypothetical protein [Solirubrobacteraceae bacterium]